MTAPLPCPICKKAVPAPERGRRLPPHFPFCSERCKMIDLGHWFTESYAISRPVGPEDEEDGADETPRA